jgi:hypothetical protein
MNRALGNIASNKSGNFARLKLIVAIANNKIIIVVVVMTMMIKL